MTIRTASFGILSLPSGVSTIFHEQGGRWYKVCHKKIMSTDMNRSIYRALHFSKVLNRSGLMKLFCCLALLHLFLHSCLGPIFKIIGLNTSRCVASLMEHRILPFQRSMASKSETCSTNPWAFQDGAGQAATMHRW